ncbi:hypothetical protein BOTU111921_00640 [Bordetella tumbae]
MRQIPRSGGELLHVPFKGATQALPALINGDVDVFFDMVATGMPQVTAGKLNVLATLQQALTTTLQDPAVREKMLAMGIEPRSGTAAELTKQIRDEQPVVKKLVNQANLKPQ